jgi:hypothetical protein
MSQVAKWAVGGILLLGLGALTGWWLYLKPKLIETVGGIPTGAVIAFDLPNGCPTGWTVFEPAISRVIVGSVAGRATETPTKDMNGKPLTAHQYRADGGEEKHRMTISEMPSHHHQSALNAAPDQVSFGVGSSTKGIDGIRVNIFTEALTSDTGGGEPFGILQPFIALHYCRKDS